MQALIETRSASIVAACAGAAVVGWLGVTHWLFVVVVVAVPIAGLAYRSLGRWRRGILSGILVLAVLNGIPLINLDGLQNLGFFRAPFVELLLVFACVLTLASDRPWDRVDRFAVGWSALFLGWWTFEVVRAIGVDNVPLKLALESGYDFLFFALLVAVLPRALGTREDRLGLMAVLAAGGAIFSAAVIARDLAGVSLRLLIHDDFSTLVGHGYVRDFSSMVHVPVAMVAFGLAAAALAHRRSSRLLGAAAAIVAGAAVTLEFVRALYFGLAAGIVVGTFLWASGRGRAAHSVRMFATLIAASMTVSAICIVLLSPHHGSVTPQKEKSPIYNVTQRIQQGTSDVSTGSGTIAQRSGIASAMLGVLGNEWPIGLGMLNPQAKYEYPLPNGDIRESDVGFLNVLMPMGAVGAILLYLPLVAALWFLVRAGRETGGWIAYGAAMWLLGVIASSITLITLFSPQGLALVATLGTCAVREVVELGPQSEAN